MRWKLAIIILFFVMFSLVGIQSVVFASQSINLSLSPSKAYVGETTTFTVEFTSTQNLSNAVVHFYVDAEKKGAISVYNVERNKRYITKFDYFFNTNSYLGAHYTELEIDYITENKKNNSDHFYATVDVYDMKKRYIFIESFLLCLFFILIICSFGHYKYSKCADMLYIEFSKEQRKTLFSIIIAILPISIPIFTLFLTENTELKIGISSILLSFTTSFILAIYMFIKAEEESDVAANKVTVYSVLFLLLGLIQLLLLVLFD